MIMIGITHAENTEDEGLEFTIISKMGMVFFLWASRPGTPAKDEINK